MQYAKHVSVRHNSYPPARVERTDQQVTTEQQEIQPSTVSRTQQIVYTIYGLVAGLLFIRFVFALLGANPANGIADFIYTVTHPLVSPFATLFGVDSIVYKSSRFEFQTLAAIAIYGLIAWAIARLVGIDKDAAHRDLRM